MDRKSLSSVRSWVAATLAVCLLLMIASPAAAHDPIFVESDQTSPDTGPYMPDGTISWALYGSVLDVGDTRGFEFDLRDGDELYVSLLIPNIEPEISLGDDELPTMELLSPDGSTISIVPEVREVFDEPFSGTSYITLAELRQPGQGGRYQGTLTGNSASRFTVAIGEEELFFTETERSGDRPSSFLEISGPLNVWYSTPAGEEPAVTDTDTEEDVEIDVELIEEAMEAGEAEAPESALEDQSEDAADSDIGAATDSPTDDGDAASGAEVRFGSVSVASVVLVLAGLIGGLWFFFTRRSKEEPEQAVEDDEKQLVE